MLTIVRYVLLTARRDRFLSALIVGMVVAVGVSAALGATALAEEQAMAVTFAAAAARLILVVGIIVFAVFHLRQAFDNKEIDVILSRPFARQRLVIAYWLGFACLDVMLAGCALAALSALGSPSISGLWGWGLSLLLELFLVSAFALFAAFMLKSASVAVLGSLAFYTLARLIGYFLALVQSALVFREALLNEISRLVIEGVALFAPRLDFFGKTKWLVYGFDAPLADIGLFVAQGMIFTALLLLAAMGDFAKRQF